MSNSPTTAIVSCSIRPSSATGAATETAATSPRVAVAPRLQPRLSTYTRTAAATTTASTRHVQNIIAPVRTRSVALDFSEGYRVPVAGRLVRPISSRRTPSGTTVSSGCGAGLAAGGARGSARARRCASVSAGGAGARFGPPPPRGGGPPGGGDPVANMAPPAAASPQRNVVAGRRNAVPIASRSLLRSLIPWLPFA